MADATIPELYLPPWMSVPWAGAPVWAWLALPVVAAVAIAVARLIGWTLCRAIRRRESRTRLRQVVEESKSPVQIALAIGAFRFGRSALPLPAPVGAFLGFAELAATTAAVVWLLFRWSGLGGEFLGTYLARSGKPEARAMVPLMRKSLKTALVLFGIIFLLQNAGFDVAAILAGLGIGGLAIALAGQKTVENLFGGIALTVDQPARVGEFCKFDGTGGTIEDIGLRSTRVRTAERTLVTIPNSKLSEMKIENFASRGRILLQATLSLSLHTPVHRLEKVLAGIREIFASRGETCEGTRVRLVGFTTTSFEVELFGYVGTANFDEFLAVRETIYLEVLRLLDAEGVKLAALTPAPWAGAEEEKTPESS